jgi:hypothetical protein
VCALSPSVDCGHSLSSQKLDKVVRHAQLQLQVRVSQSKRKTSTTSDSESCAVFTLRPRSGQVVNQSQSSASHTMSHTHSLRAAVMSCTTGVTRMVRVPTEVGPALLKTYSNQNTKNSPCLSSLEQLGSRHATRFASAFRILASHQIEIRGISYCVLSLLVSTICSRFCD